jgi:hypothetical protein
VIDEMITTINSSDPNAIVVFQADHGYSKYKPKLDDERGYEIFNLIKIPESCHKKIDNDLGSIASINLVFSCFRYPENTIYKNDSFIVKERNTRGTIFQIFN